MCSMMDVYTLGYYENCAYFSTSQIYNLQNTITFAYDTNMCSLVKNWGCCALAKQRPTESHGQIVYNITFTPINQLSNYLLFEFPWCLTYLRWYKLTGVVVMSQCVPMNASRHWKFKYILYWMYKYWEIIKTCIFLKYVTIHKSCYSMKYVTINLDILWNMWPWIMIFYGICDHELWYSMKYVTMNYDILWNMWLWIMIFYEKCDHELWYSMKYVTMNYDILWNMWPWIMIFYEICDHELWYFMKYVTMNYDILWNMGLWILIFYELCDHELWYSMKYVTMNYDILWNMWPWILIF